MWSPPSNKRTAPPSNNSRQSKKGKQNTRTPCTQLTEAQKSPPEIFDCIKLTSTNFNLFNIHSSIKSPFDQDNRYMPNQLHQYALAYAKDPTHTEHALKHCLFTATDEVCSTDMKLMTTHLEYLKMPEEDDVELQTPLVSQVVEILTAHPYLIAPAFGTIQNLQGSINN